VTFEEASEGLLNGDFSRLEPLFVTPPEGDSVIVGWCEQEVFDEDSAELAEAFTCACFNGREEVVDYLLRRGADPDGGNLTGMNALHWASNRGQVGVVKRLIRAGASLEAINRFGGTVLSGTIWSVLNEPRDGQLEILELLLKAGARVDPTWLPTGDARVDALLGRAS
jgi:ankyrin repeat protein